MKKIIIVFAILSLSLTTLQAQKFKTRTGIINFDGVVPAFEPVRAQNNAATCILDTKNGQIASLILIRGFKFKVALMEEHFNENYMDSDKFPKATLKGFIENFNYNTITETEKDIKINASLELHGVTKQLVIDGKIKKFKGDLILTTDFGLTPEDFQIIIPGYVKTKIAKKIKVTTQFLLK